MEGTSSTGKRNHLNHVERSSGRGEGEHPNHIDEPSSKIGNIHLNHVKPFEPNVEMQEFLNESDTFAWKDGTKHTVFSLNDKLPFQLTDLLGHSGKASVKIADCRQELKYGRVLACKVITCEDKKLSRQEALEEPKNMQGLRHHHIVALVGTYIWEYDLGILMYPAARYNLHEYMKAIPDALRTNGLTSIDPDAVQRINHLRGYFVCLSQALRYLHTLPEPVKHKDIKPRNILIDDFNAPILTDFDISHRYIDATKSETEGITKYTHEYASPETADFKRRTFKSDVFSLGCVFLEMATIILGKSLDELKTHIQGNIDAAYRRNLDRVRTWTEVLASTSQSSPTRSLDADLVRALPEILRMLSREPLSRPSADSLRTRFQFVSRETCKWCDLRRESRNKSSAGEIGRQNLRLDTSPQFLDVQDQFETSTPINVERASAELVIESSQSNSNPRPLKPVSPRTTFNSLRAVNSGQANLRGDRRHGKSAIVYYHEEQKFLKARRVEVEGKSGCFPHERPG